MTTQNPYAGNASNNWGWATTLPVDSDIYHDIEIEFSINFVYGDMNHVTNPFRIKWVYDATLVISEPEAATPTGPLFPIAGTLPPPAGSQPPPAGTFPAGSLPPPAGSQPPPAGTFPPGTFPVVSDQSSYDELKDSPALPSSPEL